jgi:hypothetical protein
MDTRHGARPTNALKHELDAEVTRTSKASSETVYELLSDLRSHAIWGGERQSKNYRLISIEAPDGPATIGTEFFSVGTDPMGEFHDRSVVTEATRASAFGFVTEAHFVTKRGAVADWTNVHRYGLVPLDVGCRITYTIRVARISALPGMLRLFNAPVLSRLLMWVAVRGLTHGVRNLAELAEDVDGTKRTNSTRSRPEGGER